MSKQKTKNKKQKTKNKKQKTKNKKQKTKNKKQKKRQKSASAFFNFILLSQGPTISKLRRWYLSTEAADEIFASEVRRRTSQFLKAARE